ncbi:hypothetical protein P4O66_014242 [Electrophorus voltai]|uniref:Tetraspanin-33 n=1 Tax=Electrophorus voltai TaxID=2609070 RepID=A0AAD8YZQ4_9TELE|nr:hypothetical protein P4O66_014242 [Electrophorus voltai]
MAGKRDVSPSEEDFTFVSPVVKYLLFFFNTLFWIISLVLMSIGVYARITKHGDSEISELGAASAFPSKLQKKFARSNANNQSLLFFSPERYAETAMACLTMDPSVLLMAVGILMFLITFCGCVGSLRENICLLQTFCICLTVIFLLQLTSGVLGFVFSDKVRHKVTKMINNAIEHYRDDLDLQNLIDFGQKEFACCGGISYLDWSQNVYFNCSTENPSRERCSVPFSCCLISKDENVINTMCGHGMQELDYVQAGIFINTNGCIDKLVNWIHSNLFVLGGLALGLAIPQVCACQGRTITRLVGIMLSQVLINQIQDQIKLQDYNLQHHTDLWS